MLKEFKEFALKGNMIDMAVGIIIGGAVGKLVTSLVEDVIMPPIGLLSGGTDFSDIGMTLQEAAGDAPAVVLKYGAFIQSFVDFIILAFAIFMMIKVINSMKRKEEEAPEEEPAPSNEEVLLTEIRDLLKKQ
ncbi:MAG: large-conductance mechanosensitive channel protein MscL [Gammaproteobacteria bacterium]|nr:large-conductance mechanosensitive channel protein MscL [Gammaproteobacteria bacterium]